MSYNPVFNRPAVGKFRDDTSFVSIISGSDSYLLEDEVNELQWIQTSNRTELFKDLCSNGYLKEDEYNHINVPGQSNNIFMIDNFKFNVNGHIAKIYNTIDYNTIKLNSSATNRIDFVYLEVFLKIIDENSIYQYGGLDNERIDYEMLDSRIQLKTSQRIQLQWKFSIQDNITYISKDVFANNTITSKLSNNVITNEDGVYYSTTDNESIIDKKIYAFPICVVTRKANVSKLSLTDIIDIREDAILKDIDNTNNNVNNIFNRLNILEERVNSIQTEVLNDQEAYGISMNKKTGVYTGSTNIQDGTTVTIDNYSVANNNYVVAITNLGNNYSGQIGEVWGWQDGDKYHLCNSGDENILFNSFDFRNDNDEIISGYINSSGLKGTPISIKDDFFKNGETLSDCLIYVMPMYTSATKPTSIPSIGDIFIDISSDFTFYIFNTGANNIRLQWFVLSLIDKENISFEKLRLNESTIVNDAFGKHHCKIYNNTWGTSNILMGTPEVSGFSSEDEDGKLENILNIGEIYINQNKDVFMINTSSYGNANLNFAAFKTVYK